DGAKRRWGTRSVSPQDRRDGVSKPIPVGLPLLNEEFRMKNEEVARRFPLRKGMKNPEGV
ncbi:hypothetical protein, partial [Pelagicoccus mobilis]|uniref:hypothetical protein n=1 Tax=Pelagicoccus mobilis TaxID=415221 RepID=UPI001F26B136